MIIPARWNEILDALHRGGFPEAVIAGGALRDLDNGKPIKDVDVFVAGKGGAVNEQTMLNKAFGYAGVSIFEMPDDKLKEEYPDWNDGVCGVYNFKHDETLVGFAARPVRPEFQVIVLGDMESRTAAAKSQSDFGRRVVDDFDMGLCQIWYDGPDNKGRNGAIKTTAAYIRDHMDKLLTVIKAPNEAQLERTKKRIDRLLIKYPDFTPRCVHLSEEPVIPDSLAEGKGPF